MTSRNAESIGNAVNQLAISHAPSNSSRSTNSNLANFFFPRLKKDKNIEAFATHITVLNIMETAFEPQHRSSFGACDGPPPQYETSDEIEDHSQAFETVSEQNLELQIISRTKEHSNWDIESTPTMEGNHEYFHVGIPSFSNGLTTFAYQQALRNRISEAKLVRHAEYDTRKYTPTFIHDCLMLPGSLANILGKVRKFTIPRQDQMLKTSRMAGLTIRNHPPNDPSATPRLPRPRELRDRATQPRPLYYSHGLRSRHVDLRPGQIGAKNHPQALPSAGTSHESSSRNRRGRLHTSYEPRITDREMALTATEGKSSCLDIDFRCLSNSPVVLPGKAELDS